MAAYQVRAHNVTGGDRRVRTALGASLHDVVRMVLLEGLRPSLAGIAGALSLAR
jgi:hypothetical protein